MPPLVRFTVRGLLETVPPVNSLIAKLSELLELSKTDEPLTIPPKLIPVPVAAVLLMLAAPESANAPLNVIAPELLRLAGPVTVNAPSVIPLELLRLAEPPTVNALFSVTAPELLSPTVPETAKGSFEVIVTEFVSEREANDWVLVELRVVILPALVMMRF